MIDKKINKDKDISKLRKISRKHLREIASIISPSKYTDANEFVTLTFLPYLVEVSTIIETIGAITNGNKINLLNIFKERLDEYLIHGKEENNG